MKLGFVTLAALLGLSMVGCAASEQALPQEQKSDEISLGGVNVTVPLYVLPPGVGETQATTQKVAENVNVQHNSITVTVDVSAQGSSTQAQTGGTTSATNDNRPQTDANLQLPTIP